MNYKKGSQLLSSISYLLCLCLGAFILIILFYSPGLTATEGISVWVENPMEKIFKNSPPPLLPDYKIKIKAARGEYEPIQIAVRSEKEVAVTLEFSNLNNLKTGAKISSSNFEYYEVGFIPIKYNSQKRYPREVICKAPCEIPDVLFPNKRIDIKPNITQPIWINLYIPTNTPSGGYEGEIKLIFDNQQIIVLPISLKVYNFILPAERHLYITNWFSVDNIAKFHNLKLWSEEFWKMLENYAYFIGKYRQNVVITPVLQLTKIKEIAPQKYEFNFDDFDRFVNIFIKAKVLGKDGLIEGGHIAGRLNWFSKEIYLSTFSLNSSGTSTTHPAMDVRDSAAEIFLSQFLPALQSHLKEKGWLNIYVQHLMDEPIDINAENYAFLFTLVKKYAPKIRILDANLTLKIAGSIDIWVPILQEFHQNQKFYENRKRLKEDVWFYTCLNPKDKYLNRFLDYHLIKVRLLHWVNFLYNLSGYLHWGYNCWTEEPFKNAEPLHEGIFLLPPGDNAIIYPGESGPLSSLRLEMQREGIEDYEYFYLLEKLTGNRDKVKGYIKQILRTPNDYDKSPSKLNTIRDLIAQEIEKLVNANK